MRRANERCCAYAEDFPVLPIAKPVFRPGNRAQVSGIFPVLIRQLSIKNALKPL